MTSTVALRITATENWTRQGTPQWVFDEGAKYYEVGGFLEPDYDDPVFLAAVEQGEECEVRLRMLYEAGEWDLTLRYDGEVFHLDDGAAGVFRYLIVDEVDDPPASASFRRAVHYLLSEDPDMTWERYFARMVSSAAPQDDFPATASLFTIYE